jgi:hypothetical protein
MQGYLEVVPPGRPLALYHNGQGAALPAPESSVAAAR